MVQDERQHVMKTLITGASPGIGATWLLSILPFRFNEQINCLLPKKVI